MVEGGSWIVGAVLLLSILHPPSSVFASVQQEVYVTATVESFGGYRFSEGTTFQVTGPGEQPAGRIRVDGIYNGPYPWVLRVYTDNLHFAGVGGAVRSASPAGLISEDGQFAIPLRIHCPAWGPGVFRRIPDLNEPGYLPYGADPEPGETLYTDCILLGIDPRNATWVAGPDGLLYTEDDNLLGDNTLSTPFELLLQADIPLSAVRGRYDTILYFEIVPAP